MITDSEKKPRYFYMTMHLSYGLEKVLHPPEEPDERLGWRKAWSDVTSDGIFAVYRKEVIEGLNP